jgi:hypothetical protein
MLAVTDTAARRIWLVRTELLGAREGFRSLIKLDGQPLGFLPDLELLVVLYALALYPSLANPESRTP